jgi:threonyl-tRNA synthetase
LKDAIGRTWQCGTLQVDLNLPGRLGATYIDEHSQRQTPVMLHRAILALWSAFSGFCSSTMLAKLPAWLAPTQGRGDEHHRPAGRLHSTARGNS